MEMSIDYIPQGWQCPICKRVYAPFVDMCRFCGEEQKTITTTTSGSFEMIKQIKHVVNAPTGCKSERYNAIERIVKNND